MLLRSLIQNKLAVAGIHSLADLQEHYWYLAEIIFMVLLMSL